MGEGGIAVGGRESDTARKNIAKCASMDTPGDTGAHYLASSSRGSSWRAFRRIQTAPFWSALRRGPLPGTGAGGLLLSTLFSLIFWFTERRR